MRFSPPMTCTIPLPNLDLPRVVGSPGGRHEGGRREGEEEEEEEEEEERLYLHLETRERVQTNEAKSKRCSASPTQTTSHPASQCLPSRRVLLASEGYRQPNTPPRLKG